MKYPKEITDMSFRLGHTPEHLIKSTIKYNYSFIFFYFILTLVALSIFVASIVGLKENTIISDIISSSGIIISVGGLILLNILSLRSVIRCIFDKENLAIEILVEEQREYETTAECNHNI